MTDKTPVTADNFARAESDTYFGRFSQGRVGVLIHRREPAGADTQNVVGDNPNVLISYAVCDLDAGPVTLTLPDAGERFMPDGHQRGSLHHDDVRRGRTR